MVADCLEHDLPAWFATRVAVWLELVPKPMSLSSEHFEIARQIPESLLHLGLVRLTRVEPMVGLQLLGQSSSKMLKVYLLDSSIFYKSKYPSPRGLTEVFEIV